MAAAALAMANAASPGLAVASSAGAIFKFGDASPPGTGLVGAEPLALPPADDAAETLTQNVRFKLEWPAEKEGTIGHMRV